MPPARTFKLRVICSYLPRPDSGILAEGRLGSLLVTGSDPVIEVAVTTVGLNCTTTCSDWPGPIVAIPPPLRRLYGGLGVAGKTSTWSACVWLPLAMLNFLVTEVPILTAPKSHAFGASTS